MGWMAPKLKHRIQIRTGEQLVVDDDEGFKQGYETLTTIWAELIDKTATSKYVKSIRGSNIENNDVYDTIFRVRYVAVKNLGKSFSSGFSGGSDSIEDLNPIAGDYFIFLQVGNDASKGRLFKVIGTGRDDDRKEWLRIYTYQVEEKGTGND